MFAADRAQGVVARAFVDPGRMRLAGHDSSSAAVLAEGTNRIVSPGEITGCVPPTTSRARKNEPPYRTFAIQLCDDWQSEDRGARIRSGLDMLYLQALAALEIWDGNLLNSL